MTTIFPGLPGYSHGVVALAPFTIQCNGCGDCYSGVDKARVSASVVFNVSSGSTARLCYGCWARLGWYLDPEGISWRITDPRSAAESAAGWLRKYADLRV